jgi:hypothetical protein
MRRDLLIDYVLNVADLLRITRAWDVSSNLPNDHQAKIIK